MQQTASAIRAGISGFREFPDYMPILREFDDEGDPVQAAALDIIEEYDWSRLFELIAGPVSKLIDTSGLKRSAMKDGGLYFALPYKDQLVQQANLAQAFLEKTRVNMNFPYTKEFGGVQLGATGIYALAERAIAKMRTGEIKFCIIAAVDSYVIDGRLDKCDEEWRLKTDRNPTGFIPGEAGAALLMTTEDFAQQHNLPVRLKIDGLHSGQEPNGILGGKFSSGVGLTNAIQNLAQVSNRQQPWKWVLTDLNGERYKAHEWGIVMTRVNSLIDKNYQFAFLADVIGEVGAATSVVQIGCIIEAIERGYAPDDSALLFAGNDGGKRSAMSVSRPS
jgi:3-oxoacyl-[acyl-carrier-protein] synthase-1